MSTLYHPYHRYMYFALVGVHIALPTLVSNLEQEVFYSVWQYYISLSNINTLTHTDTSDIQQISLTFFENNIFMTCTFADTVTSQGCIFNFTLANGTELFYLSRDPASAVVSQCNVSSSQRMAYTSFEVMDWESDGSLGSLRIPIPIPPGPVVVEQEANYTQLTDCVVESKPQLHFA